MTIKKCAHCAFEGSLNVDSGECPRCGGDLRTETKAAKVSGDSYSMD
jgi:hypothetical protein